SRDRPEEASKAEPVPGDEDETPDVMLDRSFRTINDGLADEVLEEVMRLTSTAFERLVIDLLSKMGYGGAFEDAGRTTRASGDEGIDGVIMEDKLGFGLIYIQAKRWDRDRTVGRPELQAFVGAISGKGGKGLFVTTAKFSKQAQDYARQQHIILIDGDKLARLMIDHDFCVSVKRTFAIKAIDTDAFADYDHED
ncbi:MAG: restriction endonuclease, partial [Synergistaceae bacterium]|nr:restriction endonuclease [Synergistaceae bacterium]